jgi:carboxyl-terminal processing protease
MISRTTAILLTVLVCVAGQTLRAGEPIRFSELYDLLKTNLLGATETELNRAAVQGLLDQLRGRVALVDDSGSGRRPPGGEPAVTSSLFDRAYGYLRLTRLDQSAASEFVSLFERLSSSNRIKGLVIDLRFAGGQDYAAAVAIADLFFAHEQPLIDWGQGWRSSTPKTNTFVVPLAVLVNGKTSGAAEALAGILRYGEAALLLGTNTAGQASMAKEFTLKDGQRLRVAVAPVKVINGEELPFTGIKPDIHVDVSPDDEVAWYADAYKLSSRAPRLATTATNEVNLAGTNRPARRRMNEAELIRMSREGILPDVEPTNIATRVPEPAVPVVRDAALARALDLLKGLAVVQQFRPI